MVERYSRYNMRYNTTAARTCQYSWCSEHRRNSASASSPERDTSKTCPELSAAFFTFLTPFLLIVLRRLDECVQWPLAARRALAAWDARWIFEPHPPSPCDWTVLACAQTELRSTQASSGLRRATIGMVRPLAPRGCCRVLRIRVAAVWRSHPCVYCAQVWNAPYRPSLPQSGWKSACVPSEPLPIQPLHPPSHTIL
jgi:hypothetical protein